MKRILWLILLAAGLFSCAPFNRNLMVQADKTLAFIDVRKDPPAYQGKTVLWGGVIVETTNRPNESMVKVRETELDYETRPKNLDRSPGRFIIRVAGFLDPAIYREGREITVIGELAGKEVLPVGNTPYPYPVVAAKEVNLWGSRPARLPYPSPWYDPFWYGYPPYGRFYPYYR
jgi:outer membrane lipoprotein